MDIMPESINKVSTVLEVISHLKSFMFPIFGLNFFAIHFNVIVNPEDL